MTFPDQERAHIAAMWTSHHDGRFKTAALEALEAADCVGARTVEGGAVFVAQAQVYATLALAEQQRIANVTSLMQMRVECDENTDLLANEAMRGLIEYDRTPATPFSGPDEVAVMRPGVREALGL